MSIKTIIVRGRLTFARASSYNWKNASKETVCGSCSKDQLLQIHIANYVVLDPHIAVGYAKRNN